MKASYDDPAFVQAKVEYEAEIQMIIDQYHRSIQAATNRYRHIMRDLHEQAYRDHMREEHGQTVT